MIERLRATLRNLPVALRHVLAIAFLVALNIYICLELFRIEYSSHLESIEAAFISISSLMVRHGIHLDWFPEWYGGIPSQNSYPPLLHALAACVAILRKISPALAHHICAASFYCLGPIGVYCLTMRLARNIGRAFAAALLYSLFCPSTFLTHSVQTWTNSIWDPARLWAIMKFGDSPHVSAVALIPFAILALDRAVMRVSPGNIALASVCFAAVALTNWLGTFALALATASYLLAAIAVGRRWPHLVRVVFCCAIPAYALASPWIPPSTIDRIRYNAQFTIGRYPLGIQQVLYAIPLLIVLAAAFGFLKWIRASLLTCFAGFFFVVVGGIIYIVDEFGVAMMPQPERYHHEVDLAFDLLIVSAFVALLRYSPKRFGAAVLIVAIAALPLQIKHTRNRARYELTSVNMKNTIEYQASNWLREHVGNQRVFISGSIQFWLNTFTDTPQIGGGFGQGIVNSQNPIVHFGIPWTQKDGKDTAMWLKLYGASAVVVSGKNTRDAFPEVWKDPQKFDGVLPEIFHDGGDVIYSVPLRSASLAHVIAKGDAVVRPPINNVDFESVRALDKALDNPSLPLADFRWLNRKVAAIHAQMAPGQLLFVQISHHFGWHAEANGKPVPIRRDGLGQMIIDPQCSGNCDVRLTYDGGLEMKVAKAASSVALLGVFGAFLFSGVRRFKHAF